MEKQTSRAKWSGVPNNKTLEQSGVEWSNKPRDQRSVTSERKVKRLWKVFIAWIYTSELFKIHNFLPLMLSHGCPDAPKK